MKKIAITVGDPGGVGPEVVVKAVSWIGKSQYCNPIVIGDIGTVKDAVKLSGLPFDVADISGPSNSEPSEEKIEVIDIGSSNTFKRNAPSAEAGRAAVSSIRKAVELALNREVSAIVTAPLSKESLKMAGYI